MPANTDIVAVLVAIVGLIVAVMIPEVRAYFGLDGSELPSRTKTLRRIAGSAAVVTVAGLVLLVGYMTHNAPQKSEEATGIAGSDPGSITKPAENPSPGKQSEVAPPPDAAAHMRFPVERQVCTFKGEARNDGRDRVAATWKKVDSCEIPSPERIDTTYRQGDFQCCAGGGTSKTTSADIPNGLELRTSGFGQWAIRNPTDQIIRDGL